MSIFDMFRGNPNPTTTQSSDQQPAPIVQPGGATNPNNPTVPAGQPAPAASTTESSTPAGTESPLDKHADLWKIDPNKAEPGKIFSVDPVKLQEAAGKVNFAQVVPPEALQKMANGGQEAVEAFVQSMNSVAQASYAQSALAATQIVEQALQKAQQSYDVKINDMIKRQAVSESLRSENPMMNNPAVAPLISALEAQLIAKNPSASSSEITKTAKEYITEFVKAVAAPAPAADTTKEDAAQRDYDFSNFLK